MRSQGISISQRPINDSIQSRLEGFSKLGQPILHPGRHFRVNRPGDQPEILQAFQRLGKHFPGNVRHVFLEIPESAHAVFLHGDHGQDGPFVPNLGEGTDHLSPIWERISRTGQKPSKFAIVYLSDNHQLLPRGNYRTFRYRLARLGESIYLCTKIQSFHKKQILKTNKIQAL